MAHRTYSKKEIVQKTGLRSRTVQYLKDLGVVEPDIHDPRYRGGKPVYSHENLIECMMVRLWQEQNYPMTAIQGAMEVVRQDRKAKRRWWVDALSGEETDSQGLYLHRYNPDTQEHVKGFWGVPKLSRQKLKRWNMNLRATLGMGSREIGAIVLDLKETARQAATAAEE